ncbi:MAG: 2-C-methyl-D-erythritol 2,4-cyclodiphosphate synthase [Patescibacteria group bacterium]
MNVAIILAAGKSTRAKQDKLFVSLHGFPLWTHSYNTFLNHPKIDKVILVVPNKSKFQKYINEKTELVIGGKTRMESFKNALSTLKLKDDDIVLDHNAANPFVSQKEISEVIKETKKYGAAALSSQCIDTTITALGSFYSTLLDRSNLRLMQTPQAVRGDIIKKIALNNQSDLCSAILPFHKVKIVEASQPNKKITFSEDLKSIQQTYFIGEDSHAFSAAGTLVLGGLKVKSQHALLANSDGDVILHAIGRALAQAKNLSFSKIADELCKFGEKNSANYLKPFLKEIDIQMISLSIECDRPKIDALPIKKSLSRILKISEEKIRISAHSGEGLKNFKKTIRCTAIITCICK